MLTHALQQRSLPSHQVQRASTSLAQRRWLSEESRKQISQVSTCAQLRLSWDKC